MKFVMINSQHESRVTEIVQDTKPLPTERKIRAQTDKRHTDADSTANKALPINVYIYKFPVSISDRITALGKAHTRLGSPLSRLLTDALEVLLMSVQLNTGHSRPRRGGQSAAFSLYFVVREVISAVTLRSVHRVIYQCCDTQICPWGDISVL